MLTPINFQSHWVLLVTDFQRRETMCVYFKKETGDHTLDKLDVVANKVWQDGCQGGLRCGANNFFMEQEEALKWKVKIVQCGKNENEKGENISYKRLLAMIYEISCNDAAAYDTVVRFAPQMAVDGFIKGQLALIQAAIAVRCVGHYPVRSINQEWITFNEQARRELRAHYEYQ